MSNPTVGIDISMFQPTVPPGPWLFTVHKATEGTGWTDPKFQERFPAIVGMRGAYHYARPGQSDGKTQANHFADVCLANGFRVGVDMWQLDAEDGENANISPQQWRQFITDFMWTAFYRLGRRAFLYAGWPFLTAHDVTDLVSTFQWWLPDYGPNDGQVHPMQTPPWATPHVVLHQYTSAGGLDQNVVANQYAWEKLFPPPAPPKPSKLALLLAYIKGLSLTPLHFGDKGPRVQRLNALLASKHFPIPVDEHSDEYGWPTRIAIGAWKWDHHLKNLDETVCGAPCFISLLKGK